MEIINVSWVNDEHDMKLIETTNGYMVSYPTLCEHEKMVQQWIRAGNQIEEPTEVEGEWL